MTRRLVALVPSLNQVMGIALVAVGIGLVYVPLGLVAGGVGLFLIGLVQEMHVKR